MAMQTFYLTTPLYYPNARPHVGSAYTTIVCDVLARYKRMCGYDVAFLTGTDEHGEKLERAAAAAGKSPSEFVAEQRKLFVGLWRKLGIQYDYFVYTDQPEHVTSVQRMLQLARKNEPGVVEKRRYEGRYCIYDERYVSDSTDPVNCDICGRPAELISEENYFFKLSAFEDRLLKLYRRHLDDPANYPVPFVQPDFRLNEVASLVKGGLRDISISRKRIKWGVPWPDDPEQVFYVWYDALIGYMTGIGYAQGEQGSLTFRKYWRNTGGGPNEPPGEFVHMIGKDILRQHAVYWPAFLMAAGLPLPKTVFAHGYINYEQDKMSKSKGNVVYPEPIVDALDSFGAPGVDALDSFGAPGNDALRYYLLREAPFGQDMSFSYEGLIQRYNSDLANGLGNLASRLLTMIEQHCRGVLHPVSPDQRDHRDQRIGKITEETFKQTLNHYDQLEFSRALEAIWSLSGEVDKYLVETKPWAVVKVPGSYDRFLTTVSTAYEALAWVVRLAHPVLPHSTERIWRQMGQTDKLGSLSFDNWLPYGAISLGRPKPIFPRLDKNATLAKLHELAEIDRERDKPKEASKAVESETVAPGLSPAESKAPEATSAQQAATGGQASPERSERDARAPRSLEPPVASAEKITIDDFAKVEMRVGEVLAAEPIPGAKKLLKLQVDIGTEVRQVCAGIAEYYKPEDLVGMKVVIVANLAPRKLRGVESNGMILAASVGNGDKPVLVTFKEDVPKGARLK